MNWRPDWIDPPARCSRRRCLPIALPVPRISRPPGGLRGVWPRWESPFYGLISQGYKTGGFQPEAANPLDATVPFDEETVTNYELGFKGDFGDRFRLNATAFFADYEDRFLLPRPLPELDTAWLGYPLTIRPDAGFERPAFQAFLDERSLETRTIWSGNVARQPMLRDARLRIPEEGLPVADEVMARGVLLPLSHAIDDEDMTVTTRTHEQGWPQYRVEFSGWDFVRQVPEALFAPPDDPDLRIVPMLTPSTADGGGEQ